MKMFHAPVERSTVDPSYPVPRSKTAPVKIKKTVQKWCRKSAVLESSERNRALHACPSLGARYVQNPFKLDESLPVRALETLSLLARAFEIPI
jgi:hypothetical protein